MYNLTVSYSPTTSSTAAVARPLVPMAASQALRGWFEEEATGYLVTCHDESGVSVTKARLRELARRA